mmetsp:Transcript_12719/g.18353  ORF Transcript_12719/g.18353 Transcript_12719/m.18353 type:complete len:80 (+) Transcript_12719:1-240(+)
MAIDGVPNIRFNVAKSLQVMAPACGLQAYKTQICPVLRVLVKDPDRDVRYFAEKSLEALAKTFCSDENDNNNTPVAAAT